MCLHTNRHAHRNPVMTAPTPNPLRWISFDSQPVAFASAVQHLKDFTVHIRHPKFAGDAKVVEVQETKLVVAPCTVNGFARPITLDPRDINHLHVYR